MPSVLVVDDEDQVRALLRTTLEKAGYQVVEGRTGKEGLERYRESPTDLVIMDILMPGKDGLESIMELRSEYPAAKIIAITGGSQNVGSMDFLDVAKMMGARRTLHKPFQLKELLEAAEAELLT